jgi:hypothetical protein
MCSVLSVTFRHVAPWASFFQQTSQAREVICYTATAVLAISRTSLRDHGFEVNRTPSGRTAFETGLPDVTRTST